MKTLPILAACAAILVAPGCNLAPKYKPPQTAATTDRFKEAVPAASNTGQGWKIAEPNDTRLGGNWWEIYHDPQLSALEARVAISNQTVAAAEANYRVARALVGEAQAAYYPMVSLEPSVIRSRSSASAASSGGGGSTATPGTSAGSGSETPAQATGTHTLYTLPVDATYEVDLWGKVRNTVAQSSDTAQSDAADVATALLSTQSQLAVDYFQLRAVDEQRRILDTTLADYEASLHLVQTLFNNGLASDEDLAEADTQLDSAEAQATDLGVSRAQLEHAIAVLIGVSPGEFSLAVLPFNPALPLVPVVLPSDLLERRPDIASAERQVAAANAGIGIARSAYFPNLSLGASAGFEATGLSHLFDWPNRFWSFGPSLVQPLFEGGLLRAENAQARAEYDQTVANYRQTVLAAFQSVEDDLSSLRILSKEARQQHRATAAAQHEVELTVTRYKDGLDSYVNVITAQNTFLTNREAELQVQLRLITANINLVNNLGGGWDTSQLKQTERTAQHPPDSGEKAKSPPEDAGPGVPNPAPLPNSIATPEDLLKQNEADMSPPPAAP
jgi:NodT family efflux transporter outer membrane factor (OMF) lipoprotein